MTDTYQLVCAEHEEHWRHQFYLCLRHEGLQQPSYFQSNGAPPQEHIDETSALVIYNFMQWDPKFEDPLNEEDKRKYIEDDYTLKGQYGLKSYLEQPGRR